MPHLHCFVLATMLQHSKQTAVLRGSLRMSLGAAFSKHVRMFRLLHPSPHTIWPNLYTFTVQRRMSVSLRLITTSIGHTTGLARRHLDLFDRWPLFLGPLVLVLRRAPFFLLFVITSTVVAAA